MLYARVTSIFCPGEPDNADVDGVFLITAAREEPRLFRPSLGVSRVPSVIETPRRGKSTWEMKLSRLAEVKVRVQQNNRLCYGATDGKANWRSPGLPRNVKGALVQYWLLFTSRLGFKIFHIYKVVHALAPSY